jgi:hypothetical protein
MDGIFHERKFTIDKGYKKQPGSYKILPIKKLLAEKYAVIWEKARKPNKH